MFSFGHFRRFLSSLANFERPNLQEVRQEFRAYGNGSVDFETRQKTGIGIIKLNYPERKNAMSGRMMADFYDIMTSLESRNDVRGLILTGQGDFFCAGGDLTTITTHLNSPEMGWKMTCLMHETLKKFSTLPQISVALVHGRALGGGAELTLAPDFRIFAEKQGKLSFVQAKMGLMPGWGGATRLKKLIGRSKALQLLLSCRSISADEALHLGICDKIVEHDKEILTETENWLCGLLQETDPKVLSAIKSSLTDLDEMNYETERRLFAPLWAGPANREALRKNLKH